MRPGDYLYIEVINYLLVTLMVTAAYRCKSLLMLGKVSALRPRYRCHRFPMAPQMFWTLTAPAKVCTISGSKTLAATMAPCLPVLFDTGS